jgi:hypothetical protein
VLERIVGGDGELQSRQVRQARARADRDQDALGGVGLAIDLDCTRRDDPAVAVQDGDAGVVQHAQVDAVQTRDLSVARVDQGAPVELDGAGTPAVAP